MVHEDIFFKEDLINIMDEKGYVHHDITIRENRITTLGKLKKVYGTLGIDSVSLVDLGELNYVKQDFWIQTTTKNLKSLFKLERVGGNVSLRYSNLSSLGNLCRVEGSFHLRYSNLSSLGKLCRVDGRLSLRDSKIKEFSNLKYVGELFLPKRFEGGNFDFIETKKKIRFWNDIIEKKGKELEDVGGENLYYELDINFEKNNYSILLIESKIPTNPRDKYYKSWKEIESQNQNFHFYKNCIKSNHEFLNDFDDFNIRKFFDRLKFEQLKLLKTNEINEDSFIKTIIYYEKVFSNFDMGNWEFIDFIKLKEKHELLLEVFTNSLLPSFSESHELELKFQKRFLNGKIIMSKCVKTSYLNGFIVKNIDEFNDFIDKKLDDIYKDNYSFYYSLFGDLKSVKQINDDFPKKFKINPNNNHSYDYLNNKVRMSENYIRKNKNTPLFRKYYDLRNTFDLGYDVEKIWNSSEIWLTPNQNPLSYYGNSTNSFIYFVEKKIHEIFSLLILNSQDEFRVFKGVPKIGEGWVSETELYNLLKYELENEEVIPHGKPKWLGKQHVDIWFPKYNIGVEYQGKQHYEPIEFFGGEESFIKNQERDKRKKKLFKENNSILIEVRKGYDIEKLITQIKNIIN